MSPIQPSKAGERYFYSGRNWNSPGIAGDLADVTRVANVSARTPRWRLYSCGAVCPQSQQTPSPLVSQHRRLSQKGDTDVGESPCTTIQAPPNSSAGRALPLLAGPCQPNHFPSHPAAVLTPDSTAQGGASAAAGSLLGKTLVTIRGEMNELESWQTRGMRGRRDGEK